MRTAIVIINFRTADLVIGCLESLKPEVESAGDIQVFIGDAASGDGSTERISDYVSTHDMPWASVVDIGCNGGFAFANNYMIRQFVLTDSTCEFVHFLNPDTYIHPKAVTRLVEFLDRNPEVAVAGSRLENPDGTPRSFAFRFPTPWREFFRGANMPLIPDIFPASSITIQNLQRDQAVDWVSGASFLIRRIDLEKAGLMDSRYFLYFEETDLMFRIRKMGREIWHLAESRVVHIAGQATGLQNGQYELKRVPAYWFQSRFKFFHDNYGLHGAWLANLLFLSGQFVYILHRAIRLKPLNQPPCFWRDFLAYGFKLPQSDHGGR
jgi:GT2 family glycosyltransferase